MEDFLNLRIYEICIFLLIMNKTNEYSKQLHIPHKRNIKYILLGFFLIIFGLFFFLLFSFWIILSKTLKISDDKIPLSKITQFLIDDEHYCLAIPLMLPILIVIFYFRKIALGYFRYS